MNSGGPKGPLQIAAIFLGMAVAFVLAVLILLALQGSVDFS
jgi:hypothetical protein